MWELAKVLAVVALAVYVLNRIAQALLASVPDRVQAELEWRRSVMKANGLDAEPPNESRALRQYRESKRVWAGDKLPSQRERDQRTP